VKQTIKNSVELSFHIKQINWKFNRGSDSIHRHGGIVIKFSRPT